MVGAVPPASPTVQYTSRVAIICSMMDIGVLYGLVGASPPASPTAQNLRIFGREVCAGHVRST